MKIASTSNDYTGYSYSDGIGTMNRVGELLETLAATVVKLEKIKSFAEMAMERADGLKNGIIAKDPVSGLFMSAEFAKAREDPNHPSIPEHLRGKVHASR